MVISVSEGRVFEYDLRILHVISLRLNAGDCFGNCFQNMKNMDLSVVCHWPWIVSENIGL